MMLARHCRCVFTTNRYACAAHKAIPLEASLQKTRELFGNPLVPRRLVLIRLQRAAMYRTARSDAIAPSSKLDDWGQQACLRRCKNASIMMLCRATNVARATGRRTFADGPLLKTMLYDLHVCQPAHSKRSIDRPRAQSPLAMLTRCATPPLRRCATARAPTAPDCTYAPRRRRRVDAKN